MSTCATTRSSALVLLVCIQTSLPASAQVARGLVRQGDAPTGVPAGHSVVSFGFPTVNEVTGYATVITTTDGAEMLSHLWGSKDAIGAPDVFRTESTLGSLRQDLFHSPSGYSDAGEAAYGAVCYDLATGSKDLSAIFQEDHAIALEGQPIPSLPGKDWGIVSSPGAARDGVPYWIGKIIDASSGKDEGVGLFYDKAADVVLKSGDVLPGTNGPVSSLGLGFFKRFDFSASGKHYIAEVGVDPSGYPTDLSHMVVDGQVLAAFGTTSMIREGDPVPPSAGGLPNETWYEFGFCGINDGGDWFFTGYTSLPSGGHDWIVVKNGKVLFRTGQTLEGQILVNGIDSAAMNGNGRIACIWTVIDAVAGAREALFLDDDMLVREGDAVDLDGDGWIEPTAVLVDLEHVALGSDDAVYLVATVDVYGTPSTSDDIEGLFRIEYPPLPYGIGKLNSAGKRSSLVWSGLPSLSTDNFKLRLLDLTPNNLGIAFWGPTPAQVPLFNHFLYVGSPITRILPPQKSSPTGTVLLPIAIDPPMVGTTRYYQYWQRDPQAPDGTGVELSNGLEVLFRL